MQDWVAQFLDNQYLYFESANEYPNVRTLVPQYGDYINKTDILGYKYKSYSFVFIGYEKLDRGTSDVNSKNMLIFDSFIEWLEGKQEAHEFPDFGPKCSDYEIKIIQNMANIAFVSDDNLAKYMLGVKINYKEEP